MTMRNAPVPARLSMLMLALAVAAAMAAQVTPPPPGGTSAAAILIRCFMPFEYVEMRRKVGGAPW